MQDDIKLNLVGGEALNNNVNHQADIQTNIPETLNDQVEQKVKEQQPNLNADANLIAQVVAQTIMQMQSQQAHNDALLRKQKEEAQAMRTANNAGKASKAFVKKMVDEIARGDYVNVIYYPALAKKFGTVYYMVISGYTIHFQKGLTTKVPKSLASQVNAKLMEGDTNSLLEKRIEVKDYYTNKNDPGLEQEVTDKLVEGLALQGIKYNR